MNDIPLLIAISILLWDNYKYFKENEQLKHNQQNYIAMLKGKPNEEP